LAYFRSPLPHVSFGDTGLDHLPPMWRDNFHFTENIAFLKTFALKFSRKWTKKWHMTFWLIPSPCFIWWHCHVPPPPSPRTYRAHRPPLKCHVLFEWPLKARIENLICSLFFTLDQCFSTGRLRPIFGSQGLTFWLPNLCLSSMMILSGSPHSLYIWFVGRQLTNVVNHCSRPAFLNRRVVADFKRVVG